MIEPIAEPTKRRNHGRPRPPGGQSRMTGAQRRSHLLDTAAALIVEAGFDALTMEGVAARAGVSKTLGYAYFANIDDLLVTLHDRELAILLDRIEQAAGTAEGIEPRLRAAVHAYFGIVAERGPLLAELREGLRSARLTADQDRPNVFVTWLEELFHQEFPTDWDSARAYAGIFAVVVDAHAREWHGGPPRRRDLEERCVRFALGGLPMALAS